MNRRGALLVAAASFAASFALGLLIAALFASPVR